MKILFASVAAVAIVSVFATINIGYSSTSLQPSQEQPLEQSEGEVIKAIRGPSAFLSAGGRSAIVIDAELKEISLSRGESANVTLNIQHMVGNNGFDSLHLVPAGSRGNLGLPSSAADMTPEERTELIKQGKPIPGTIPLSSFVRYSDPQITVNAGETKSIQMTITIPKSLPDEMLQKSIHISPNLTIVEMQNASPDRASDAIVFSDMVTVTVAG